ncbi:MAG: ABC transporter permease [Prevotellaceae bacterium]|jgi:ABC-2 type transport system permease protein|nr:ABC transporter permease [Prevotellaceae bacterium]
MSKIGIIIGREYKTRVMKKSFIFITLITPVLMALLMLAPTLIMTLGDSSSRNITVIDQTGIYAKALTDSEKYHFIFANQSPDEIRAATKNSDALTALLVITDTLAKNPKAAALFSHKQIDIDTKSYITDLLDDFTEKEKLSAYNIPNIKQIIEDSKANIDIQTKVWSDSGEEKAGSSELALILGMVIAMLIFMFIMTYGSQVMTGVIQEKTSRIVEVIVSSAKPFELMMGKIVGVALVGLTQMFIWGVFVSLLYGAGVALLSPQLLHSPDIAATMGNAEQIAEASANPMVSEFIGALQSVNFLQIGVLLIVYFLGGYLLYASFFAAMGSAVDSETDTQQFTLPITMPMLFAMYAGIYASQHPDSALAFWGSIIPFTSPVVMMARLPFGVDIWQIALSVGLLALSFVASTWLAAKIYRTGILMYGKKPSWKELYKWLKY